MCRARDLLRAVVSAEHEVTGSLLRRPVVSHPNRRCFRGNNPGSTWDVGGEMENRSRADRRCFRGNNPGSTWDVLASTDAVPAENNPRSTWDVGGDLDNPPPADRRKHPLVPCGTLGVELKNRFKLACRLASPSAGSHPTDAVSANSPGSTWDVLAPTDAVPAENNPGSTWDVGGDLENQDPRRPTETPWFHAERRASS